MRIQLRSRLSMLCSIALLCSHRFSEGRMLCSNTLWKLCHWGVAPYSTTGCCPLLKLLLIKARYHASCRCCSSYAISTENDSGTVVNENGQQECTPTRSVGSMSTEKWKSIKVVHLNDAYCFMYNLRREASAQQHCLYNKVDARVLWHLVKTMCSCIEAKGMHINIVWEIFRELRGPCKNINHKRSLCAQTESCILLLPIAT